MWAWDTMQELWNTCALLEVKVGQSILSKMSVLVCIWHFLPCSRWEEWNSSRVSVSVPNRGNLSPEASTSLPCGDTKNFVFNSDSYGCIFLLGEFSHKPTLFYKPTCPSGRECLHHCQWSGIWDHPPALGEKSVAKLKELAHSAGVTWLMLLEAQESVFTGAGCCWQVSGSCHFHQKSSDV